LKSCSHTWMSWPEFELVCGLLDGEAVCALSGFWAVGGSDCGAANTGAPMPSSKIEMPKNNRLRFAGKGITKS
jgi:hypothetical protein